MKRTVTTVREYNDEGKLVKETVTEVTEEIANSAAPLAAPRQVPINTPSPTPTEHPWWYYTHVTCKAPQEV